ncbi:cell division suppressor protein YneA [Anaerosporobacter faecicola]|uniref:cell division suppressor protein YneA n=1 Tax=Anaerosporobacter faecicola TaxID=2718714 RepID=UPI00143BF76E|nr:LysM peptidoglycan-binding domain-containing protein [Anaerosporobacter faecicola]
MKKTTKICFTMFGYKKEMNRNTAIISVLTVVVLVCALIGFLTDHSIASASDSRSEKYVKSIQIVKGDTLWGIAEENITSHYRSIEDYIDEIMECNALTSDVIHEGQYLIVPYYCSPIK